MKNIFCSVCGVPYADLSWPRTCQNCGDQEFENPTPVVIVLQPVVDGERTGVLIAQRAIEPAKGQWSLISGYMNTGETAEDAASREFHEETSLMLAGEPRYAYSTYNQHGLLMLCFHVKETMPYSVFLTGVPCPENYQLGVHWMDEELNLAFPLQSDFTERWKLGHFG